MNEHLGLQQHQPEIYIVLSYKHVIKRKIDSLKHIEDSQTTRSTLFAFYFPIFY